MEKYKKALRYVEFARQRPDQTEEERRELDKASVVPIHSNLAQVYAGGKKLKWGL